MKHLELSYRQTEVFLKKQNLVHFQNDQNLWLNLYNAYKLNPNGRNLIPDSTYVELKLLSNAQLQANLKTKEYLIDSIVIKGKMYGNYFSSRKKFSLFPLFPILYSREEYKILLGNDEEGNLILLRGTVNEGFLLFLGDGRKINHSIKYTKN